MLTRLTFCIIFAYLTFLHRGRTTVANQDAIIAKSKRQENKITSKIQKHTHIEATLVYIKKETSKEHNKLLYIITSMFL
jgi:hypothetical protein